MDNRYQRIAVMGGTFDPVHLGHLIIAEQSYNHFHLDKVIFMPAGIPPHKSGKKITASRHRLEMLKRAISDNPHFDYSTYELEKEGKSYTVETLRFLYNKKIAREIYFIIGADSLLDIYNWKEPEYLLEKGNFIVAPRPGYSLKGIFENSKYNIYRNNIYILKEPLIDISSSRLREQVNRGESIRYQTLPCVISYIEEEGLYRGD
ncbi:nicotinate-nucleotide adenylyltransferase [Halothermothrix orenii]|uniref:Probable nicotinate-nucleotide adenylyltransferase n=1 Tax=Halothermothrix orenii (strain H 168 / OCM 544 / DSM 9562) TaxID=373903 RepID=B8CXS2_HALOH|nr:nicotinate-nucleotide adenylyltransferase [Halothermothrix orenii]ACL70091.1 nicotinate (nicotinamide) nucleotide adenylyltransferase [Halothermothrix orenii H 168]